MLGRKREDQKDGPGGKKRKKWQEESDDEEESEAKNVTVEEMEEWKAKMEEEEKQEERERQKREREARAEAERKERERLRRLEEEERERRELEEQMEEEERERQEARREAAERAAEEAKRLWDKPPAEAAPGPVVVPALIASAALPPVPAPAPVAVPAPKTLSALMQAQAAGANIAASLLAAQPAMAPGIPGMAMAGGEEAAAGDITAHVQVPAGRVKDLLGVQGRNIKALKSQTGVVKVGVLDRNDPANVEIVGAPAAVEKCKALVNCIVEGDLAAIGNITEILDIEPRLISRLIGPRGQNISNMKDQSGAYLGVKEPTPGMGNKVVIVGFPECVARAKELVVSFLSHEAAAAGPGAGPAFGMGMPVPAHPVPQPPLPPQPHAVPVNAVRPMQGQVPPMPAPGWTGHGMGPGKGMPGGKAPDTGTWTPGKGACDGGWHDPSAWQGEGHQWGVAKGDWGPPQPCRGQFGKGPCSPAVTGHGHGDESWPQESWDYGNSAASGAVYQQGPHQAADYAGAIHTGRHQHGSAGNGFDVRSQGKGGSMEAWSRAAASQEQWHGYGNDQQGGWGHWSPQAEWDERWGGCDGSNGSGQKGAAPMHHASAYGGDAGDYGHHPEWGSHM